MNRDELKKRLIDENIPKSEYSINGGLPNEACCIGISNGKWEVYYSERGLKTGLKIFIDEEEACEYFYKWLTDSLKDMKLI